MDFFEEQERARSRTGWLIVLFSLAVCGTVMAVYAAMKLALQYAFDRPLFEQFWNGDLFWRVAANTVALIAAVSFFKIRALSDRGHGRMPQAAHPRRAAGGGCA